MNWYFVLLNKVPNVKVCVPMRHTGSGTQRMLTTYSVAGLKKITLIDLLNTELLCLNMQYKTFFIQPV
jgi:hypothetical protein